MGRGPVIHAESTRVRPAAGTARRELWFLHGYASDQNDLFGLARLIPEDWTVRSLQAPRPLPTGGYAWYDLHFDAQGVRQIGMNQVRESLDLLKDALDRAELPPVLFGFSQGGIMANALAASCPERLSGCIAVASYFPTDWFDQGVDWKADEALPHLAVVGDEDGVIPPSLSVPSYAQANARQAGIEVQHFRMGHGIAPDAWQAIARWMASTF